MGTHIYQRLNRLEALLGDAVRDPYHGTGALETWLRNLPSVLLFALRRGCFPIVGFGDGIDEAARLSAAEWWALLTIGTEYEQLPMPERWPGAALLLGPTHTGLEALSDEEVDRLLSRCENHTNLRQSDL